MSRSASGGRTGSSSGWSLRLFGYAAGMMLAGGVPVLGTLQALSTSDPPLRIAVMAAWLTHATQFAAGTTLAHRLRTILAWTVVALVVLVLLRLLVALHARSRRDAVTPAVAGRSAAPSRRGAVGGGGPSQSTDTAASGPVIVVGAITGSVGRAWLDGRLWTVRGGAGPLRKGDLYVVVARHDDVLEVMPAT